MKNCYIELVFSENTNRKLVKKVLNELNWLFRLRYDYNSSNKKYSILGYVVNSYVGSISSYVKDYAKENKLSSQNLEINVIDLNK